MAAEVLEREYKRMKQKYHDLEKMEKAAKKEYGDNLPQNVADQLRRKKKLFRDIKAMKKRIEDTKAGRPVAPRRTGGGDELSSSLRKALGTEVRDAREAAELVTWLSSQFALGGRIRKPPPAHADPAAASAAETPPASPAMPPRAPVAVAEGVAVEVVGLKSDVALNGTVGRVMQTTQCSDKSPGAIVAFPRSTSLPPRLLRTANLSTDITPRQGLLVDVFGLQRNTALNGQQGVVLSVSSMADGSPGAVVRFDEPHGEQKLRHTNLIVVCDLYDQDDDGSPGDDKGSEAPERGSAAGEDEGHAGPGTPDSPSLPEGREPSKADLPARVLPLSAIVAEVEQVLKADIDRPSVRQWLLGLSERQQTDPFCGMEAV